MAKIRLSEKYLSQITDVVNSTTTVEYWWEVPSLEPFSVLAASVARIHHPHLSERDANLALIHAFVDCIGRATPRPAGTPIPGKISEEARAALFDVFRAQIESLPWELEVKFPLPKFGHLGPFEIQISDSIMIRNGMAEPVSKEEGLNKLFAHVLAQGRHAELCVKVRGYADSDPGGNAVSQAISLAKQCLYFLDAFSSPARFHGDIQPVDTYVWIPNERVTVRLPDTLTRYLCGLSPKMELLEIYGGGNGLLSGGPRIATTPEEQADALALKLYTAQMFFARNDHPDVEAIGAAMEWYVDSIVADNQTFAYIAACIGLEALLGYGVEDPSEKMEAMSPRLSDRYGFLLGVGRADRDRLASEFREMLKLRGKLVHARNKRLNAGQRTHLYGVQNMLANVIRHEVQTIVRIPLPEGN
nr:hypothetical protein [Achromobacter ruhlandii]